jgi:hypothetical protein
MFHLAILWESRKYIADGNGDFIIFYTGAQIINDGRSKELFNVETQNAYQAKFDVPQLEWPLPFNHAPYELFLFLPLAHLPYPLAHAIWSGINLVFLGLMLRTLLRYLDWRHWFFVGTAVLAWFPTMETFRSGQDSIMSTVLLLGVFVNLKQRQDGWAGFCLALGLYKPQLVLPMVGTLLIARRWYVLKVFSITGIILTSACVAMVGWKGLFDLVFILRAMEHYSYIVYPANMPNIRGFFGHLPQLAVSAILSGSLTIMISLVLYALCLFLWARQFDVFDPSFDLKFSLCLVTTVLISYHLYAHDLFPLTISLVLFFRYITLDTVSSKTISNIFFVLILVFLLPVIPRYLIQYSALSWAAVPILVFYSTLIVEILYRSRISFEEKEIKISSIQPQAV